MVLELTAGRLIARHLGSSLYTWTSVIGIVLSGIAAGNYLGGRLADRFPPKETLCCIFLIASANCLLIPLMNNWIGNLAVLRDMNWPLRIASHVFLVFFMPSSLLGIISPVAAKMAIELGQQLGRTVGNVYSWGAIGSIIGTFLTGYILIDKIGTTSILIVISGILLCMALGYGGASLLPYLWTGVLFASMGAAWAPIPWAKVAGERLGLREYSRESIYQQEESQYSFIRVEDVFELPGVRSLRLDFLVHAYLDFNDPDNLHYDYERVYAGITKAVAQTYAPDKKIRALFLGGGGYVFPRWFLRHYPSGYGEVAELDPAVTRVAYKSFGLEEDTALKIHHLDARNHVEDLLTKAARGEAAPKFDLVYNDAFNHYSPPFHLTTYEFAQKIRALMSDNSVFLANVIDIYRSGRLLGAMINTIGNTFPYVYTFCTSLGGPSDSDARDTFIVVGSTYQLPIKNLDYFEYSASLLTPIHTMVLQHRSNGLILTDDYAPVDNLIAPVIRQVEKETAF